MMNKWLKYFLVAVLVFCLILVRAFENELFYDPFLAYFARNFENIAFPYYDLGKVNASISLRYAINALLTTFIIAVLFQNKKYTKFTILVLIFGFMILLPIYNYAIKEEFKLMANLGFTIRRFLLQPLFVLILIPAFFYQNYQKKNNSELN